MSNIDCEFRRSLYFFGSSLNLSYTRINRFLYLSLYRIQHLTILCIFRSSLKSCPTRGSIDISFSLSVSYQGQLENLKYEFGSSKSKLSSRPSYKGWINSEDKSISLISRGVVLDFAWRFRFSSLEKKERKKCIASRIMGWWSTRFGETCIIANRGEGGGGGIFENTRRRSRVGEQNHLSEIPFKPRFVVPKRDNRARGLSPLPVSNSNVHQSDRVVRRSEAPVAR